MPYAIRPAQEQDIPQLAELESEAFPTNWPPTPFKRELYNRMGSFLTVYEDSTDGQPSSRVSQQSASAVPGRQAGGLLGLLRRLLRRPAPATGAEDSAEPIAGYVGTWFMTDEAHITGIAVRGSMRGRGLGELLLIGCIETALKRGSRVVTLEVRVSNNVAQSLYAKYGFEQVGSRKRYYTDNNEDAYIMTTNPIDSDAYRDMLRGLLEAYQARHGEVALALG